MHVYKCLQRVLNHRIIKLHKYLALLWQVCEPMGCVLAYYWRFGLMAVEQIVINFCQLEVSSFLNKFQYKL